MVVAHRAYLLKKTFLSFSFRLPSTNFIVHFFNVIYKYTLDFIKTIFVLREWNGIIKESHHTVS